MSARHRQSLEMRRLELVERSTARRAARRVTIAPRIEKTATIDRMIASVRRYPVLVAVVAGAVALLGSRKLFSWIARGLTLYTLLRKI